MKYTILLAILATTLFSCINSKIKGRWIVNRVQEGRQEIRPKGRWVEFYDDNRQENGSGWQKHGVGTYNIKKKIITLSNENGYADEFDTYKVKIKKDDMEWSRKEDDGLTTKVLLSKIEEVPMSHRDKLLGVWTMKTALEDGKESTLKYNPKSTRYMLIRWDNMFINDNTPDGRQTGMYRVVGDRFEIEMNYHTAGCKTETWNFQIWPERLVMTSVNADKEVILEFTRARKIPENEN